jgi:hypothetical protein
MLQSVPSLRSAKPRLLCTFTQVTPIMVQVIGPYTLYLAETDQQLMENSDAGTIDAIQINQASGLVVIWVNGCLYAAGSQAVAAPFLPFIYIPNVNSGGLVNAFPSAYGVSPSPGTESAQ